MEFRLTYRGKLPAAQDNDVRFAEKHLIRKQIHKQMRELWKRHPALRWHDSTDFEERANSYIYPGFRFVPLISQRESLACSLDILFLRRDEPGGLVYGGDIDNRIKVLFDGLKIPSGKDFSRIPPADKDEDPFFVLLEDDSLIAEIKVTTDRLLTPLEDEDSEHDVHLVIYVRTLTTGDFATIHGS